MRVLYFLGNIFCKHTGYDQEYMSLLEVIVCLAFIVLVILVSMVRDQLKRIANALEYNNKYLGVYDDLEGVEDPTNPPTKKPGESWQEFKVRTGRR